MSTTFTNTGNFTGNLTGTGTNSANTNTGMATGTGTGSWADSTHSVIWMSRSGKSPATVSYTHLTLPTNREV